VNQVVDPLVEVEVIFLDDGFVPFPILIKSQSNPLWQSQVCLTVIILPSLITQSRSEPMGTSVGTATSWISSWVAIVVST
jgi:hypothetical protein